MKSFKHFKEDSDSDDRGSESLSKLKSRKELAKQRSLETLQRFKERSGQSSEVTRSKTEPENAERSKHDSEMAAKKAEFQAKSARDRAELGTRAKELVKKGIKRVLGRK